MRWRGICRGRHFDVTNFPTFLANNVRFPAPTNSGGNDVFVTAFNTDARRCFTRHISVVRTTISATASPLIRPGNAYIIGQTLRLIFRRSMLFTSSISGRVTHFSPKSS
jgi:hypothetical protein